MSGDSNSARRKLKQTSYTSEEIKKIKEKSKKEIYEYLVWADTLRGFFDREEFSWILEDFHNGLQVETQSGKKVLHLKFNNQEGIKAIVPDENESLTIGIVDALAKSFADTYYKIRGLQALFDRTDRDASHSIKKIESFIEQKLTELKK